MAKIKDIKTDKPIVTYETSHFLDINRSAQLSGVKGHPRNIGPKVITSKVISIFEDGFETLNTVYQRESAE